MPPWKFTASSAAASWRLYTNKHSLELTTRSVLHKREVELPVLYKGHRLSTTYRADFICFDDVIVEIKAIAKLSGAEEAQIINYLKATGYRVGLLLNFGF